ncbi:MAG: carbohydrate ABC transporter substrate-binding protein [Chloroflexi bacterium]|nr:carbohydrate ABC transporter substrate-binding protein [Chloroflexota bacterium]
MSKRLLSLGSFLFILAIVVGALGAPTARAQDDLSGQLEIFSWWSGDEGPALEALIALFNEQHPNVELINATVAGGSGVNARAVLKTRMEGGEPPDSFQVHAGQELIGTWVVADRMEDLSFLYEEQGWYDVFPEGLIDLLSTEDGIWSVPVNIHRSNVMWYNPAKVEEWGIEVPTTWDEFLAVCPTLQDAGVTPLAIGEAWTVNHLWESVALGTLGAEGWNGIWSGETDLAGEDFLKVWDTFGKVLACSNFGDDNASLSWQQAIDRVVDGSAAFNVMGDWAAGYMSTTLGLVPGEGFGYVPSPGTAGTFLMLSDSFGLPVGAPNRDNAIAWLTLLGSKEGQDAFNPLKGSIPARIDGDVTNPDLYNAYLQSAAADWAVDTIVGSLVHGAAANENFNGNFSSVIDLFTASGDPSAASAAFVELCSTSGACGG